MSRAAARRSGPGPRPQRKHNRRLRFEGKRLGWHVFTRRPMGGKRAEARARRRAARTMQQRQRAAKKASR